MRRPSSTDGRVTNVELSGQGRALLPDLKAAWAQLAEQTVASMSFTPTGQLADVLTDLAASLAAAPIAPGPVSVDDPPCGVRRSGRCQAGCQLGLRPSHATSCSYAVASVLT